VRGKDPTTTPATTNKRTFRSSRVTEPPVRARVHFLRGIGVTFARLDVGSPGGPADGQGLQRSIKEPASRLAVPASGTSEARR
jgi:hypothetical protein